MQVKMLVSKMSQLMLNESIDGVLHQSIPIGIGMCSNRSYLSRTTNVTSGAAFTNMV